MRNPPDVFADLSAGLTPPDWHVRVMACRALKELGLAGRRNEAIEAEVRALKDDDALVREIALESLAELGPEAVADLSRRSTICSVGTPRRKSESLPLTCWPSSIHPESCPSPCSRQCSAIPITGSVSRCSGTWTVLGPRVKRRLTV